MSDMFDDRFFLFKEPPPRWLADKMKKKACRHYRIMQKFIGIALISFGCFYTSIFAALNAPWEIIIAFGSSGILGVMLIICRVFGKFRIIKLLRIGIYAEGELIALAKPKVEKRSVSTSYEACFIFRDKAGRKRKGRTWIGWQKEFQSLNPGDVVPVCYNPSHPSQNILLLAIL
jgi:hypothetical protein